jgi:hypothetical protein
MGMVFSLAEDYGINDIPEVSHHIELLGQSIERHLFDSKLGGSPQDRQVVNRKKFITIFKARYLHLQDLEYTRPITGVDAKLISQLVKNLTENKFEVDEFLAWLFDEFLPANQKFCPPTIKLCCASFLMEKFLYEHKDQRKERKEGEVKKLDQMDLMSRARILIRTYKENNNQAALDKIVELHKVFNSDKITVDSFRAGIESMEKQDREKIFQEKVVPGV